MFLFIPALFLFFSSVAIRPYLESWRSALLFAATITAVALTVITEGLSLFQALSFYPLMITWLILTIISLKVCSTGHQRLSYPKISFKTWRLSEKLLLGIIIFIVMSTAVTAAVGIPNTWDSMTYHLARVTHWMQDRTVAFYPTHIIRQLYVSPWSEFAIAHLRILGGGETSANFIQWISMGGSLVGVSLIAQQLGANRRGQLMAATIAACLPMGILQSVSTQTDYACAFWLIVFVCFLFETQRTDARIYYLAAGLSLGLALLTKGNSYVFATPFLMWLMGVNLKKQLTQSLLGLLLIIVCAVGLNMGQYVRNTQAFGSPAWTNESYINESFDWKVLGVNALRNISIQLATPWADVNEHMKQRLTQVAQFFGADINDPRASFDKDFTISSMSLDEDYAGNFFHAILFVIVFILMWFYRGPKGKICSYACVVLSAFLLFCLIVRFQPWHSRFHLPLFILFCPVAGTVLEHFLKQKGIVLGILLFFGSMPWVFANDQHPWAGRRSIWNQPKLIQYFYKNTYLAQPVVETTNYLKSINCKQVGLVVGGDSWEYPWWVFMPDKDVRIEHVGVGNASASLKYPLGDFQPCALIISGGEPPPYEMVGSAIYGLAGSIPAGDAKVSIFLKTNR